MSPKPLLILNRNASYIHPPVGFGGEWVSGLEVDEHWVYLAPTAEEITALIETKISELSKSHVAAIEADNVALGIKFPNRKSR